MRKEAFGRCLVLPGHPSGRFLADLIDQRFRPWHVAGWIIRDGIERKMFAEQGVRFNPPGMPNPVRP
jgi:hypothetical protein